jgi:TRAP-type C4-dicarboxylate transport system permease small subunit
MRFMGAFLLRPRLISQSQAGAVMNPGEQNSLSRFFIRIDKSIEVFSILLIIAMVLIVFTQVMTRKLFNFVFFWSEEVTLLCLTWFSFIGIAIGFREKLHIGMDMVENILPRTALTILDRVIDAATFGFGLYMVVYGTQFSILMSESTLPATKLPNSVQYIVVPFTGVLCCIYATLQFLGKNTQRYTEIDDEIKEHDA